EIDSTKKGACGWRDLSCCLLPHFHSTKQARISTDVTQIIDRDGSSGNCYWIWPQPIPVPGGASVVATDKNSPIDGQRGIQGVIVLKRPHVNIIVAVRHTREINLQIGVISKTPQHACVIGIYRRTKGDSRIGTRSAV